MLTMSRGRRVTCIEKWRFRRFTCIEMSRVQRFTCINISRIGRLTCVEIQLGGLSVLRCHAFRGLRYLMSLECNELPLCCIIFILNIYHGFDEK